MLLLCRVGHLALQQAQALQHAGAGGGRLDHRVHQAALRGHVRVEVFLGVLLGVGADGFGGPAATAVPGRFGALALGALPCAILPLSSDSKLVEVDAMSSRREVAASSLRIIAVSGLFWTLLGVEGRGVAL